MNKDIRKMEDIPDDPVVLFANGNESTIISNTLRRQLKKVEWKLRRSTRQPRSTTESSPLVIQDIHMYCIVSVYNAGWIDFLS